MAVTRGYTKCRRGVGTKNACGARYDQHVGTNRLCPDGSGRTFLKHKRRIAASQSFHPDEVRWLDTLLNQLRRRERDFDVLMRQPQAQSVERKVLHMKESVAAERRVRKRERGTNV